jgi:hypothetical protein
MKGSQAKPFLTAFGHALDMHQMCTLTLNVWSDAA